MQDRMVVVLCNLKPSKMRGIMSEVGVIKCLVLYFGTCVLAVYFNFGLHHLP